MPVTAKLSRRFYEALGEDVANELVEWFNAVDATYRSDLRDLNEVNFARFDAKLEQRIAEVRAEMREGFAGLRADIKTSSQELKTFSQETKADLLKWMFGAAATLLGVMIALAKL